MIEHDPVRIPAAVIHLLEKGRDPRVLIVWLAEPISSVGEATSLVGRLVGAGLGHDRSDISPVLELPAPEQAGAWASDDLRTALEHPALKRWVLIRTEKASDADRIYRDLQNVQEIGAIYWAPKSTLPSQPRRSGSGDGGAEQ